MSQLIPIIFAANPYYNTIASMHLSSMKNPNESLFFN